MSTPATHEGPRAAGAAPSSRWARRTARTGLLVLLGASLLLPACGSTAPGSDTAGPATTTAPAADPGPGPMEFSAGIRLETIATDLTDPVAMTARPMRNQLWVAEREGRVRVITKDTNWDVSAAKVVRDGYTLAPDPVLDLSALTSTEGERGLLGLAFSSDGRTLYVDHTATNGDIVVASYVVTDPLDFSGAPTTTTTIRPGARTTPNTAAPAPSPAPSGPTTPGPVPRPRIDPASRSVLLTIDHRGATNHNGGQLARGPDGYLYIGVGDGGRPADARNAADPESMLGKILRIDPAVPDGPLPYSSPSDNPFLHGGGAAAVWATGLRNPWRFSFDRRSGDLWIGDVGQNTTEEIDRLAADSPGGADLGWPAREGDHAYENAPTDSGDASAGDRDHASIEPVLTYDHDGGACAVIGGFVYRGSAIPALAGVYLYGDHCTGTLRGLLSRNDVVLDDHPLGARVEPGTLTGFGQDDQGELYVMSMSGTLSVIVGAT